MVAEILALGGARVRVHERMPSPAHRLLMAGRGGLNLTHSEPLEDLVGRYGERTDRLAPLIEAFPPEALRAWADGLGQETFVGSSGRVFPRPLKASPLVRVWLARLGALGVELRLRSTWTGWDASGRPCFRGADGVEAAERADALLLALGGASWPRLGSDGGWARILAASGAPPAPLLPANCGLRASSEMKTEKTDPPKPPAARPISLAASRWVCRPRISFSAGAMGFAPRAATAASSM